MEFQENQEIEEGRRDASKEIENGVFFLEPALIFGQEAVEVTKQQPVEDRPLRISRAIDSGHGGRMASSFVLLFLQS